MLGKMLSRRAIPLLKGGFTIAGYGVFGGARIACGVLWKAVDVRAFAVHLNMISSVRPISRCRVVDMSAVSTLRFGLQRAWNSA